MSVMIRRFNGSYCGEPVATEKMSCLCQKIGLPKCLYDCEKVVSGQPPKRLSLNDKLLLIDTKLEQLRKTCPHPWASVRNFRLAMVCGVCSHALASREGELRAEQLEAIHREAERLLREKQALLNIKKELRPAI